MKSTFAIAAIAVPLAAASSALQTASVGGAKIVNYCDVDIPMEAVPAQSDASGVVNAETESATLSAYVAGSTSNEWFSPWISLDSAVDGGWSLKIDALDSWTDIMQYEYTWAGSDAEVWYDMSFVNGDEDDFPDWAFVDPAVQDEITDGAYAYSSDDAVGMQKPVAYTNTVTLVLCPESATATSATSATSTSASAAATTATTATSAAEAAASTSSSAPVGTSAAAPTTLQTTTSSSAAAASSTSDSIAVAVGSNNQVGEDAEVVTEYATLVVTAVVTETATALRKRHEHRHPHGHSH